MHAPSPDEAIVVVEQDSGVHPVIDEDQVQENDTIETAIIGDSDETVEFDAGDTGTDSGSGQFGSLEDTFSSENGRQS